MHDDDQRDALSSHASLIEEGRLVPVELGGAEERLWSDCDLASLAEGRLARVVDPRVLGDAQRRDLVEAALTEGISPPGARRYERCFWLMDDGRRVGTLALSKDTSFGGPYLRLSSFYVWPDMRSTGIGRRAFGHVRTVLAQHGLGVRLDTSWTWQRSVKFYMGIGMWVRMWKRELEFCWPRGAPAAVVDVGDHAASIWSERGGERHVLAHAERHGDRLVFDDGIRAHEPLDPMAYEAGGTLALALALRGWPLIRSPEEYERCFWADAGAPESLARKIVVWEAWAKKHGWCIQTPRIPGLRYLTWDELQAE